MSKMAVNGTELYYEIRGTGQPLLFIHGMCGDAGVWSDQVTRLSGRFQIMGSVQRDTDLENVRHCYELGRRYGLIDLSADR